MTERHHSQTHKGAAAISRRSLLKYSGLAALAAELPTAVAQTAAKPSAAEPFSLVAAPAERVLVPGEQRADVWLYNNTLPGPVLRVQQHKLLQVDFHNACSEPSTVHWHGLRLPNAMDGAGGLTQEMVRTGEHFNYHFAPPDAGTFWYHPHSKSWQALSRGLSGILIVEETQPPAVDVDLPVLLDDWLLSEQGQLQAESFGALHEAAHAGRLGNWLTANGASPLRQTLPRNARMRLRLVNACNSRTLKLELSTPAWLMAEDGQALAEPQRLSGAFSLAVGQRVDLFVDTGASAKSTAIELWEVTGNGRWPAAEFATGQDTGKHAGAEPHALPANPLSTNLDLPRAHQLRMDLQGGAMSRMASASHKGQQLDMRELVQHGMAWAISGQSGMPKKPWFDVRRGETVEAQLRNESRWAHAMHLHGHHFKTLQLNGEKPAYESWRDTILLQPGDSASIAFVADNPGQWMAHCHMLEHQLSGMMSWFNVR